MADPRTREKLSDRLGPGDSDRHVAAVRLELGPTRVPRLVFPFRFGPANCPREQHAGLIALDYSGSSPAGAVTA